MKSAHAGDVTVAIVHSSGASANCCAGRTVTAHEGGESAFPGKGVGVVAVGRVGIAGTLVNRGIHDLTHDRFQVESSGHHLLLEIRQQGFVGGGVGNFNPVLGLAKGRL